MYKSFYKENLGTSKMHFEGKYFNSSKKLQLKGGKEKLTNEYMTYSNIFYNLDSRDNSTNYHYEA